MLVREGRLPIGVVATGGIALLGTAGPLWSVPAWGLLAALVFVYFERRPVTVTQPNALVSPVGGVVTRVDEIDDPWLDRRSRRIRIRTQFPGIMPLLGPLEARITNYGVADDPFDHRGDADELKPLLERLLAPFGASPNCYALTIVTDTNEAVVVAASSVLPISRLRLDQCPGERVSQGRRYAFAYFVDMVDVVAPVSFGVKTGRGAHVRCGDVLFSGETAKGDTRLAGEASTST